MSPRGEQSGKRPGPAPRGPYADKRTTFTTRITQRTRARLEEAAAISDRSISQEAEFRLERTFQRDDAIAQTIEVVFGSRETYQTMRLLASMQTLIEKRTGRAMLSDPTTHAAVIQAWQRLLEELAPPKRGGPKGLLSVAEKSRRLVEQIWAQMTGDPVPEDPFVQGLKSGLSDGSRDKPD